MIENGKRKPLVSIIIPAYNAQNTIGATLDSVFAQTYDNLQIIVIDDASTDAMPDILRGYNDHRLEVSSLPVNVQLCAARNYGLKSIKGEYVAFMDSDDLWHPTKIEKQVAILEKEDAYGACFTWANIIDENGDERALVDEDVCWLHNVFHEGNRSHRQWLLRLLTGGNFFMQSSALIRSDVVKRIGDQNLSLLQLQDFEYWVRLLSCCNVYMICEELSSYRRSTAGTALSAVGEATRSRTTNEDVFVCTRFFDNISDEMFAQLFCEDFRNPDAATPDELACEKAFLLERAYCGREPSLTKLQELLSSRDTANTLWEKYGYTPKTFYADNTTKRYFDHDLQQILNKEAHIEQLLRSERDLQAAVAQKEAALNQIRTELDYHISRSARLQAELEDKTSKLEQHDRERQQLQHSLARSEGECQQLRDKENQLKNDLEATRNSRTWRLARMFAKTVRFFVPVGSKRALFCRLLWTMVRHPGTFFKSLSPPQDQEVLPAAGKRTDRKYQPAHPQQCAGEPAPSAIEVAAPQIVLVDMEPVKENNH